MPARKRFLRLLGGLALVLVLLAVSFAVALPAINRWGATDAELAGSYPGDELLKNPVVFWTNAITINAPPEAVWPWIAQIGDRKGGFYSYTFIENLIGAGVVYHNADHIVATWQNPQPGEVLIGGMLKLREARPDAWFLAESASKGLGWTWLWHISPTGSGQTRLVLRNRIEPFTGSASALQTFVLTVGGFVMEQNMMQGIKLRAEGGTESPYIEPVEIVLWAVALVLGLAAAILFLIRRAWEQPLTIAAAAVLVLMVLTVVQPAIWVRLLLDLSLLAGLLWPFNRRSAPHSVPGAP